MKTKRLVENLRRRLGDHVEVEKVGPRTILVSWPIPSGDGVRGECAVAVVRDPALCRLVGVDQLAELYVLDDVAGDKLLRYFGEIGPLIAHLRKVEIASHVTKDPAF